MPYLPVSQTEIEQVDRLMSQGCSAEEAWQAIDDQNSETDKEFHDDLADMEEEAFV